MWTWLPVRDCSECGRTHAKPVLNNILSMRNVNPTLMLDNTPHRSQGGYQGVLKTNKIANYTVDSTSSVTIV